MNVREAYAQRFQPEHAPSNFQLWSWFFMRISGLGLVFLVLGHMGIMHLIGGGVDRINFNFVAARWSGFFWRAYDWLLLVLALLHGAVGARDVIQDHVRRAPWRALSKAALYSVVFFLLGVGTLVIVTFDAAATAGR